LGKFAISGDLPVAAADNVWSNGADATFQIASLEVDRGQNLGCADDDTLYFATRAGAHSDAAAISLVDDPDAAYPTVSQVAKRLDLYPDQSWNINDGAVVRLDAAGNFILLESSNEHLFFASPPGAEATNSFTTTSATTFMVNDIVAIGDDELPSAYRLD